MENEKAARNKTDPATPSCTIPVQQRQEAERTR